MHLVCRDTQTKYPIEPFRWRSETGGTLDLEFAGHFDLDRARQLPPNLWRYIDALPIDPGAPRVSFAEGMTPLVPSQLADRQVHFKLDFLFPSGSYKDRGSAVMISHAQNLGVERVVQDSSGNGGASVACYAAKAGIPCDIFVPEGTSPAKLSQISAYGANLKIVPGSREDTAAAAQAAADKTFYASHVWNPFFFHGVKTFVLEIFEQLGAQLPDTIILPVGNGTLVIGAHLAFADLQSAGLITRTPRIVAVQAANCAPLAAAFTQQCAEPAVVETSPTWGEGIAIAAPARGEQILAAIRATQGEILAIAEAEIAPAWRELAATGTLIEPTSAVTVAGAKQYLANQATQGESVVCVLTGHGLKTADKIEKLLGQ